MMMWLCSFFCGMTWEWNMIFMKDVNKICLGVFWGSCFFVFCFFQTLKYDYSLFHQMFFDMPAPTTSMGNVFMSPPHMYFFFLFSKKNKTKTKKTFIKTKCFSFFHNYSLRYFDQTKISKKHWKFFEYQSDHSPMWLKQC